MPLGQEERRGYAHPQGILHVLGGAVGQPTHPRDGVVDEVIDMAVFGQDLPDKLPDVFFLGEITLKIRIFGEIDGADVRALCGEPLTNALADAVGPAGDHGDLVLKLSHKKPPS